MGPKRWAYMLIGLGLCVLLSGWGEVSDWTEKVLKSEQEVRREKVVYWTNSGSPEVDIKRAREFEVKYPWIRVNPNFRESGGLQDILYISFLSGNPPDYMDAPTNEIRDYVLIGGILPLDDLIAKAGGEEEYLKRFDPAAREGRIYRFNVNPDDHFLRRDAKGNFLYPLEAARLLAMNGRAVGFRGMTYPNTITYNKRLFREAAREFPGAGLLDANGQPVAPTTWLEFYEKAKLITEYGRRAARRQGLTEPICYGVVLQGQRQRDLMRGISPLAARAGTMAFAFQGDRQAVQKYFTRDDVRRRYAGANIGYFDYDDPAMLAAFGLLWRLKQDGLVLPGTESRHYEDVRTVLASGRAAMVIDGWHAALIGAERVPWAAQDLGSAPLPLPYPDPNAPGASAERCRAEKRNLYELLALDKVGIELSPGNSQPTTAGQNVTFFTSLCRHPDATWKWTHFADESEDLLKSECRRGIPRQERAASIHRGDTDWFPFPYQEQVFRIMENDCRFWPEAPRHGPVEPATEQEVYYKYFYQTDIKDLPTILRMARQEVHDYSEASNRDLARRIEDGIDRPEAWTFPDWDPRNSQEFFRRQRALALNPQLRKETDGIRRQLVTYAADRPSLGLLNTGRNGIRDDIWRFRSPDSAWQLLWVPALMGAVVLGWLAWKAMRNAAGGRRATHGLGEGFQAAKRGWHGYGFALPGLLAIFAFAIYPSLYQFYLSVHSGDGLAPMRYVGMANFDKILNVASPNFDSSFWTKVVPNTAVYMVVVTAGQIGIGLFLASLLNMPLKANKFYRVLFFIPLVTSLTTVSVILIGLLKGEDCGLNQFFLWLHAAAQKHLNVDIWIPRQDGKLINWLGQQWDLWTVMAVGTWYGLPYNIILLLAGLQSIDPQLYEAAKVDGANAWRRFWHVTVPEILPILIVIAFQAFIGAARAMGIVLVLTEGGIGYSSELVALYIFRKGFMKPEGQVPDLGYASALGIVYSFMLAALTVTNVVIVARRWKRRLAAEAAGKANGPAAPVAAGGANV